MAQLFLEKNFGGDERRTFDEGKAKHTNDQKKSYSRLQAKIFKTTQQPVLRFQGNASTNFINFLTSKLIYAHLLKNTSEKIQQNQLFKSNFSAESNYLLP